MVVFTYSFWDQIHETFLAELPMKGAKWVESVNGSGTFEARVVVPDNPVHQEVIRFATSLDNTLVVTADNGAIPWSGYITDRTWNPTSNEIVITAVEWRAWLYRLLLAPLTSDPNSNILAWTNTEQLYIARQLVYYPTTVQQYGHGSPYVAANPPTTGDSGVKRDLVADGKKFRSVGAWLDSIANRDRGFEWDLVFSTKLYSGKPVPELDFKTYFPERGSVVDGLVFEYGTTGNIISYEPPQETSDELVRRQWALGEGPESESQPYARDDDPQLANDNALIFDKATSWSGVSELVTLASHARAERTFYSHSLNMFQFTVSMNTPYAYSYNKGDRCALRVKDRWLDLSYDQVRIIERQVSADAQQMSIIIDLSDDRLPEVDVDGAV